MDTQPKAGKRKPDSSTASDTLEDRIASLEKKTKVEIITELKDKVRTLCLQQNPSDSLILLTLDELAKFSKKLDHDDADVYEELARQANRHYSKLDISSLCLSVLGGKAVDTTTKAISKMFERETIGEQK